jgi:proteasome lid subunit RPN8/RPN11
MVTGALVLSPRLVAEIVAHARAGLPDEVCGLIAGKAGVGLRLYRGRNASRTPRVSFEMDVDTLVRQIEIADAGLDLVAIYHSHPRGREALSAADIALAALYRDSAQLVCSLADPLRPALMAYRVAGGRAFPIELVTRFPP